MVSCKFSLKFLSCVLLTAGTLAQAAEALPPDNAEPVMVVASAQVTEGGPPQVSALAWTRPSRVSYRVSRAQRPSLLPIQGNWRHK